MSRAHSHEDQALADLISMENRAAIDPTQSEVEAGMVVQEEVIVQERTVIQQKITVQTGTQETTVIREDLTVQPDTAPQGVGIIEQEAGTPQEASAVNPSQEETTTLTLPPRPMSAVTPVFIPLLPIPPMSLDQASTATTDGTSPRRRRNRAKHREQSSEPPVPLPHPDNIRARFAEGGVPMTRQEISDLAAYECFMNGCVASGGPAATAMSLYDRQQFILAGGDPDRPNVS